MSRQFDLNMEKLLEDGKHAEAVRSADDRIFEVSGSVALALNLPLRDKTEIPGVVAGLKEAGLIDERTCVRVLDALLALDGIISQVGQGEPLSRKDIILLSGVLKTFAKIAIEPDDRVRNMR